MLLQDIKTALRITHNLLDSEIEDIIEEARHDLMLSGISSVKANDDADPLIKRAIKTYARANFGFSDNDKDRVTSINRYQQSYEMIKNHLSLAGDYNV